jgi:hypothetical protein
LKDLVTHVNKLPTHVNKATNACKQATNGKLPIAAISGKTALKVATIGTHWKKLAHKHNLCGRLCLRGAQARLGSQLCTSTYDNFNQTVSIRDGASHSAKILSVFYDNLDTSDPNDPEVIIKIDISSGFNTTSRALALDVLSGRASRDYACGLKKGEAIPTCENLSTLFGHFKGKLSMALQILAELKPVLKEDAGLELNMSPRSSSSPRAPPSRLSSM